MRRIVFTSRATRDFKRSEVADLCHHASRNNETNRLTGMFLYDGRRFLQALEGDDELLSQTLARIEQDPRHRDMTYILSEPIARREFSEWTMTQPLYGIGDDAEDYVARIKREVAAVSDPHIKAHFIGFATLAKAARYRYE